MIARVVNVLSVLVVSVAIVVAFRSWVVDDKGDAVPAPAVDRVSAEFLVAAGSGDPAGIPRRGIDWYDISGVSFDPQP